MQHSNAEFSDDSSGNLPDFGTYSLSAKNHLFFREKESDNGNNCFCKSFVLMVSLMNEHRYSIESAYQPMLQDYPASILAAGIVALTFYLCWAIWKERYKYNHSLSYWSVNEAVDDVPCGVCFSDSLGRIVLCNTKMQELCRMMTGAYLQDYDTLRKAMDNEIASEGLIRLSEDSTCFIFQMILSGCFRNIVCRSRIVQDICRQ